MSELDALFMNPEKWVGELPEYQRNAINAILATGCNADEAAEAWLNARPASTVPFGTSTGPKLFFNKLLIEVHEFLCGKSARYKEEREKLYKQQKATHAFVVAAIASAIAPSLGTAAPVLAPAIALLLWGLGKCTLNALCSTWTDRIAKLDSSQQ